MSIKDKIPVGMSLPHRSPDPIDMATVRHVAQRAEALGFSDLWVTENTLDHVFSFDPALILNKVTPAHFNGIRQFLISIAQFQALHIELKTTSDLRI